MQQSMSRNLTGSVVMRLVIWMQQRAVGELLNVGTADGKDWQGTASMGAGEDGKAKK